MNTQPAIEYRVIVKTKETECVTVFRDPKAALELAALYVADGKTVTIEPARA